MAEATSPSICVICNDPIGADSYGWEGGMNAEPVAEGRCCERCDNEIVIPTRILRIRRSRRGQGEEDA